MNKISLLCLALNLVLPSEADCPEGSFCSWVRRLEHGDASARRRACAALARTGPRAAPAVPSLLHALKDPQLVRRMDLPSRAIAQAGVLANPRWIERGAGFGITPTTQPAEALGRIGPPAVSALVKGLEDPDVRVRLGCAEALARIGPEGRDAVPALVAVLRGRNDQARTMAGYALGEIGDLGPAAEDAILELVASLKNENVFVREWAATTLGKFGPDAGTAIPALVYAAKFHSSVFDYNWRARLVHGAACKALWRIGPDALPAMTEALRDQDPDVRLGAALALTYFGAQAEHAVPALIEALNDDSLDVRSAAVAAIGEIGPGGKAAIPAITRMLQESDREPWREHLANTLRKIEPAGPVSIATRRMQAEPVVHEPGYLGRPLSYWIDKLAGGNAFARREACRALAWFGPRAMAAVPALVRALKGNTSNVRQARASSPLLREGKTLVGLQRARDSALLQRKPRRKP